MKMMTENIAGACVNLQHGQIRVQLASQRAILSFSNILVWTVKNASKRKCGHESIDAFSRTTKTHYCGKGLRIWLYLFTRIQRLVPADDTCKNSPRMFQSCIHLRIQFQHTKSIIMITVQIIEVVWQRIMGSTARKGENYEECKQLGSHLQSQTSWICPGLVVTDKCDKCRKKYSLESF